MSSHKLTVPPPKIVDREFVKPLLCGPGPSDVWPSVAQALTKPILSPICDELFKVSLLKGTVPDRYSLNGFKVLKKKALTALS